MKKWAIRIAVALVVTFAALAIAISSINGDGSAWHARRWVKRFANVKSVHEAVRRYQVDRREFSDGSWIFGVAVGSHGNPFGGTVVTKDSTGRTRVFFGHVCTGAELARAVHESQSSGLSQAFSNLTAHGRFEEQELK